MGSAAKRTNASSLSSVAKKKKTSPSADEFKHFYTSITGQVLALKDDAGEVISGPFVKLPPKKLYPDYYEIIDTPISLAEIQKKLKQNKYPVDSTHEYLADFQLLLDNAAKYNDPESWIVASAQKIYDYVEQQSDEFLKNGSFDGNTQEKEPKKAAGVKEESGEKKITFDRLPLICTALLKDVISHEFPDEGIISNPFMDDVDVEEYPDYLNYVTTPTSFGNVLKKIERKKLFSSKVSLVDNLEKFYNATMLIFTNAQLYNDPSSEIHQDAEKLKELFEEKYDVLKDEVTKLTKLRLKLKQPKVKLNLKLKGEDQKETQDVKQEPTGQASIADISDNKEEDGAAPVDTVDKPQEVHTEKNSANTLGKSLPKISLDDTVIQEASISSSIAAVNHITKHTQQKAYQSSNLPLPKNEEMKKALFPTHPLHPVTTFFEYKVPSNGYAVQSYTMTLPADVLPYISMKVSLHNLLHSIKKADLIDGRGYLNSSTDDDFQCKLFVNEREVSNGGDCFEEKKNENDLLGLQYDLKLTNGLNILDFEVKVGPNLSKQFKHAKIPDENEELAGRHTRHQLQQLKMTWEVEKITFYVICNTT
ncbi:Bromodomain-containing protein [Suhomyces tanzawaensis NRRL Y-17324]|uniref:Bromodomain-containing protein n=1 Tax=Suhomyces tanzawaensis NRRL Y-17324 TaxID=984487 RepID=A0A1E4SLR1_9ASCO|nr:Bromodomain-containing protein [Suhomyces tanzawaensis NRRL Y-17324]ODV80450.1 Bromodomain-containing protein [Suhomyces tanzawaensis NRRL Y-17324]